MKKNLFNFNRLNVLATGIVLLTICGMAIFSQAAEPRVALVGHVPARLATATLLQRASADEPIELSLVVKLDQNLLDETLAELYGQNASPYKHFLSAAEFAQKLGLADKRTQLKNFANANNLTIDMEGDSDQSMIVKVSGPAGAVEQAFGIHLNHYRDQAGHLFRANDADPMIPASLEPHLGAIVGLSNLMDVFHPHIRRPSAAPSSSIPALLGTSGQLGGLSPHDIKSIYGLSSLSLTGTGQTVALVEFDGYAPSDIHGYETAYSLPPVQVTPISIDGAANTAGSNTDEVVLDIELVVGVAPGVSSVLVYEAANNQQAGIDMMNQIATDNKAQSVSTSWGYPEDVANTLTVNGGSAFMTVENQIFQRMAAQGQSMYAAAGDNGAFDDTSKPSTLEVDDPAVQPFVTGVGGTTLSGSVGSPVETTWNSAHGATGGGVSLFLATPSYQIGVAGTASQTHRNVPDVALNADPDNSPYSIFVGGSPGLVGGTSAAAPLWAAFTALLNQQSASEGRSNFGFANPTLYTLGVSSSSSSLFKDITIGNNGSYSAGVGYDNTTGFGSFKGSALINQAAGGLPKVVITSLSNVNAFPNPWDARKPHPSVITIWEGPNQANHLPDGATVKIFTISGFLVKSLQPANNGTTTWDLTNDSGQQVASGLYFYLVKTPTDKTRGTIAIIK